MNKSLFLLSALFLVACAGPEGIQGIAGPAAPAPVIVTPSAIDQLVSAENDYRVSVGQSPLTKGLSCTLYTVANTSTGILTATGLVSKGSFTYLGEINSPDSSAATGVSVLPMAIRALYTSWYEVSCVGKIVVTENGYYNLSLTSDDGSLLYVDGALVVNNDGNHGATTVSGMKLLRLGVHDLTLKYMSGPGGNQAWMFKSSGSLVPAENMYH